MISMDESSDNRSREEKLRHKTKIGFMFMLTLMDGLVESSYGPSVKAYQCIYLETRQRISLLYPVFVIFKAIGTLLYFLLRQLFDPYLVVIVCTLVACLLLVSLPLLPGLWLALLLTAIIGLAGGIASHARLVESGNLAKDSAVPIHLVPLASCTGSVIGPLVISPFLEENQDSYYTKSRCNTTHCDNKTILSSNSSINSDMGNICEGEPSNVVYGFIAIAAFGAVLFVSYLPLHTILQSDTYKMLKTEHATSKTVGKCDIVFLFLLISLILIGGSTNSMYGIMLSTFGINSSLKISPRLMSLLTSSFFLTTLIGRIVGTCVTLVVSQHVLLTVCMIGVTVTAIGLIFLSEVSILSLWVASSVFGFMYSPLCGSVTAWAIDIRRDMHVMYGLIVMSYLGGLSLMSFVIGQLMINVDINCLNYCVLAACVLQLVIFVVLSKCFQ